MILKKLILLLGVFGIFSYAIANNSSSLNIQDKTVHQFNSIAIFIMDTVKPPTTSRRWLGVFEKGAEYNLNNLLAWGYHKEARFITINTIGNQPMPNGEYNMVYFDNDSYTPIGDTATLTVNGDFEISYAQFSTVRNDIIYFDYKNYYNEIAQDKDWIGIFKVNDKPIRENLLAWKYMEDGLFIELGKSFNDDPYKVVAFENDTYHVMGEKIIYKKDVVERLKNNAKTTKVIF